MGKEKTLVISTFSSATIHSSVARTNPDILPATICRHQVLSRNINLKLNMLLGKKGLVQLV